MRGGGPRFVVAIALACSSCGGDVVVDPAAEGAGAGSTSSGAPSSGSSASSASTGSGGLCSSHDHCQGGVCLFATGVCAPACDGCDGCGPGSTCDPCATNGCPKCDDCRGACVPIAPGQCDDDDACGSGETCLFALRTCAPACTADGVCPAGLACSGCATGSCCQCKNCAAACVAHD